MTVCLATAPTDDPTTAAHEPAGEPEPPDDAIPCPARRGVLAGLLAALGAMLATRPADTTPRCVWCGRKLLRVLVLPSDHPAVDGSAPIPDYYCPRHGLPAYHSSVRAKVPIDWEG